MLYVWAQARAGSRIAQAATQMRTVRFRAADLAYPASDNGETTIA